MKVEYVYDATGYVWQKVLKEGGKVKKRIDYVQGIQYFDQELSLIFNAEGRVTPYKDAYEYEYFLKDHLTNTRVVFGNVHEADVYKATMETELSANEEDPDSGFRNFQPGMRIVLHNHTPSSMEVTAPNEPVSLNGYNSGLVIGPAKMLTVKAGDQVNMEVFARYTTSTGSNAVVNNLVARGYRRLWTCRCRRDKGRLPGFQR